MGECVKGKTYVFSYFSSLEKKLLIMSEMTYVVYVWRKVLVVWYFYELFIHICWSSIYNKSV